MKVNGRIEMDCGCTKHPRSMNRNELPNINDSTECHLHGEVEVIRVTYVST